MPRYPNGQWPLSVTVSLGSGTNSDGYWEHRATVSTAQKWKNLVSEAKSLTGVTLTITPGWNVYRPLGAQKTAYANSAAGMAAYPGTSSHGGSYEGKDSLAIDVSNWGLIGKDTFFALARKHGFTPGVFSNEPWHIIDNDPWGAVPAALEEEDMNTEQDNRLKNIENMLKVGNAGYGYPETIKQDTADIRNRIYVKDGAGNILWDVFQEMRNSLSSLATKVAAIEAKLK